MARDWLRTPRLSWDPSCTTNRLEPRANEDGRTNNYGKALVDLCKQADLAILNGRAPGDSTGKADPRTFWQTFKATRQKALGALTPQQWHDAFRDLYDPEQPDAPPTQWAPESRPHTSEAGNGGPKGAGGCGNGPQDDALHQVHL
ncbi:g5556 [Coccomyxa viridis]|uniref:G5556 protein n=1 Tax=Coccomyxa viridis TaxID=1274662 RepID=A0ABP1FX29_9CHLO